MAKASHLEKGLGELDRNRRILREDRENYIVIDDSTKGRNEMLNG